MRIGVRILRIAAAVFAVAALVLSLSAPAHSEDTSYYIMKPEPWLAPKYRSPRGTVQHVKPVAPVKPGADIPTRGFTPPPPLVVPSTGQVVPNLPIMPSQPGNRESFSDRAVRCSHQASVNGAAVGNPSAYIGACINQ